MAKLQLASSLEELNRYAESSFVDLRKIKSPLEVAKKLLLTLKTSTDDDEKTYVLLFRFLKTYRYLLETDDKDYITKLLGTDATKATSQLNLLTQRLNSRYSDIKRKEEEEETLIAIIDSQSVEDMKSTVFNNEPFISCIDLYEVLSNSSHNILVIDVRSEDHFQASHLKPSINCINIPEDVIHYGLSANTLGRYVPPKFRDHWDKRDSFDCIVLMDWKTSSYQFTGSRLHKLKVILSEWDVNRTYHEKPTILNKGYLEFVEMYPTMCITMDDSQMMTMMDDIVDLTEINYPESSRREDYTLPFSLSEIPSGSSDIEEIEELVSIYDIDKDVALDTPIEDVALPFEELPDLEKSSTSLEGTVNVEDLLAAARQAKKPVLGDTKSTESLVDPDEKPVVDRSTKPSSSDLSLSPRWQCRDSVRIFPV
uniref:Rhodanese domain-containing protein n=1 Tax=Photinus pyralis TaxID=7054 RepID=A0A1Y1MLR2_PHOPY